MQTLDDAHDTKWLEVLAKANALLALQNAKIDNRLAQAEFLMALGITRPDAARMLGVDPATLRSLASQAKAMKGAHRGKTKG